MFGSAVLDVGIGITLLFLFVSLMCTAMREGIETVLKSRAMDLERGLREILNDQSGTEITNKIFEHPFVYSLYSGKYDPAKLVSSRLVPGSAGQTIMPRRDRTHLPTYIPSQAFAAALIDTVAKLSKPDADLSIASVRAGIATIENDKLRTALSAYMDTCGGDLTRMRHSVEGWYDATMDRVSGWYKRRTQVILLGLGLASAVAFNIDAINAARHLSTDKAYRDAVVAQATSVAAKGAEAGAAAGTGIRGSFDQAKAVREELGEAGFIVGWPAAQVANCGKEVPCWLAVPQMVLGWIVTALAVSLGAPFWFDLLNKFMVIRSTVKPAEKSGREASKDSTPATGGGASGATLTLLLGQAPDGAGAGGTTGSQAGGATGPQAGPAATGATGQAQPRAASLAS